MSHTIEAGDEVVALFAFAGYDDAELSFAAGARLRVHARSAHWATGALLAAPRALGAFPLALVVAPDDPRAAAVRCAAPASAAAAPCARCGCAALPPHALRSTPTLRFAFYLYFSILCTLFLFRLVLCSCVLFWRLSRSALPSHALQSTGTLWFYYF